MARCARERGGRRGRTALRSASSRHLRPILPREVKNLAYFVAPPGKLPHFSNVQKQISRRIARVNALAEKLRFLPDLDDEERLLYAWCLAATPDERWQRSQDVLRSLLAAPSREIDRMIRSKQATGRAVDTAMLPVLHEIAARKKRLRVRR